MMMLSLISVADDGLGMDEETVSRLLNGQVLPQDSSENRGTGIAIKNVAGQLSASTPLALAWNHV